MNHYSKYNKIEMEIFRNGELIGYNHYFFTKKGDEMIMPGETQHCEARESVARRSSPEAADSASILEQNGTLCIDFEATWIILHRI